jgi:hypothetical protein
MTGGALVGSDEALLGIGWRFAPRAGSDGRRYQNEQHDGPGGFFSQRHRLSIYTRASNLLDLLRI